MNALMSVDECNFTVTFIYLFIFLWSGNWSCLEVRDSSLCVLISFPYNPLSACSSIDYNDKSLYLVIYIQFFQYLVHHVFPSFPSSWFHYPTPSGQVLGIISFLIFIPLLYYSLSSRTSSWYHSLSVTISFPHQLSPRTNFLYHPILVSISLLQDKFPATDPSRLVMRLYPYPAFLAQDNFKSVEDVLSTFGFNSFLVSSPVWYYILWIAIYDTPNTLNYILSSVLLSTILTIILVLVQVWQIINLFFHHETCRISCIVYVFNRETKRNVRGSFLNMMINSDPLCPLSQYSV